MSEDRTGYAVAVAFYERGMWSEKHYTYLSQERVDVGDAVVVPDRKWWKIAKVKQVVPACNYPFLPGINYKSIVGVWRKNESLTA